METFKGILKTYENNFIGALVGGIGGYLLAKKLGYEKKITVIPFLVVGSITGASIQHYIVAKKGMPTADLVK